MRGVTGHYCAGAAQERLERRARRIMNIRRKVVKESVAGRCVDGIVGGLGVEEKDTPDPKGGLQ